jgi:hypothetical protein
MSAGKANRSDASRARWMALFFVLGSTCFVVGPLGPYLRLVGEHADGLTFFVGSILFTLGGGMQSWLAWPERYVLGPGRAAWQTAWIQSAGTLAFNITTFQAIHVDVNSSSYDKLVWRPDAVGSIFFLVSGAIAYRASPRVGWLPDRDRTGWWEPGINLLGCVLFGISAIAGYVVPSMGSDIDLAAANWTCSLGAMCFLACAIPTVFSGRTFKVLRLRRLRELEHGLEQDVGELEQDVDHIL